MLRRLLIMVFLTISGFCMAMHPRREQPFLQQHVLILLLAGVANPNIHDIDRAVAHEKMSYRNRKKTVVNYNNNHFTYMQFSKENNRIHQPWARNHAAKKNR